MVDLGARRDFGVFDLNEVAHMGVLGQLCTGAQAGVGADLRATRHMTAFKMRKRPDQRAALNGDAGTKDHIGFDHAVAPHDGVKRQIHRLWCHQRDAEVQQLRPRTGLKDRIRGGQIGAGIDAERLVLGTGYSRHRKPVRTGQFHQIGQVIFTRGIVVADLI